MPQVETTVKTTYKFDYDIIGDFVVVTNLSIPEKLREPSIVTLEWFEAKRAKKRGWRFLMRTPKEFAMLRVASAKYFKLYEEGLYWELDWSERFVDPANYLRKHKTIAEAKRLIRDDSMHDGWFRDIHGNVLWSRIHFSEIQSPFSTSEYDLPSLVPLLEKWVDKDGTRLVNPRIVEVFYMNQEHPGEQRMLFEVEPSKKLFEKISKSYRGSFRDWYVEDKNVQLSREWFKHNFKEALHGRNLRVEHNLYGHDGDNDMY